jgi:putative membrane protein
MKNPRNPVNKIAATKIRLQRIQRNDLIYIHHHSPSLVVAYVLAFLGVVAFWGILVSPLLR